MSDKRSLDNQQDEPSPKKPKTNIETAKNHYLITKGIKCNVCDKYVDEYIFCTNCIIDFSIKCTCLLCAKHCVECNNLMCSNKACF